MRRRSATNALIFLSCAFAARADDPDAQRRALAALKDADPIVTFDESQPNGPVVGLQFRPNYGPVTDNDLKRLQALPQLRCIELPNKSRITDAGLAHLDSLERIEELNLSRTGVTAAAVVRFVQGRTRLWRLELSGVPLTDDDLGCLSHLTNLRVLSLRGTLVSDKGARHLKAFTKLQNLNLSTREGLITDAALPHLQALPNLEYLDLDRTAITDAGLAHLTALQNLRGLQFAFTSITDTGLFHFRSLKHLESINARGTAINQVGVNQLKQHLPAIRIGYGPAVK
jgi:hypothetical protein